MFIAYMSLDEVNQDFAARAAEQYGATLASSASPAEMRAWPCDAVVYDLDYLSSNDRQHILDELTSRPVEQVAAVHSYNLPPSQKRALRRNGVVVRRRLHPGWFGHLIRGRTRRVGAPQLAFS